MLSNSSKGLESISMVQVFKRYSLMHEKWWLFSDGMNLPKHTTEGIENVTSSKKGTQLKQCL